MDGLRFPGPSFPQRSPISLLCTKIPPTFKTLTAIISDSGFFLDTGWAECCDGRSDQPDGGDRPTESGGIWEIPIQDRTADGCPLKWLTLVDEYTRECLVLHAAASLTGADVRRIVARVIGRRGAPTRIRSDNGSEFICVALVDWLPGVGATSIPVAAGSPWENGYIESFHSRLRDEFLERQEFESVADARRRRGSVGNTTRFDRIARWDMRRRRSSARRVIATEDN
jgi:transposase InsO family protein